MEINKRILASMFIISMLAFSLGYGTMSYFNDTETSKGNKFTAGTLDLKVDGYDDPVVATYFKLEDVKPCKKGEVTILLTNDGSLDGAAWLHIKITDEDGGPLPEPEKEFDPENDGDLSSELYMRIWIDDGDNILEDDEKIIAEAKLIDLACKVLDLGKIEGGKFIYIGIYWHVQDAPDINKIMGDYVVFDIVFGLDQFVP